MESISLDVMDFEPSGTSSIKIMDTAPSSVPGLDFLMNKNALSGGSNNKKSSYDLGDLDSFENEMKSLSGVTTDAGSSAPAPAQAPAPSILTGISNLFSGSASSSDAPNLGQRTKEETSRTDGFLKFTDIPDEKVVQPRMTEREKNKKKKIMINRLNEWKEKGIIDRNSHFSND
ncbi:MAG: hypothetical protein ACOVOQ_10915, partial [Flavobacterium sp.]